MDIRFMSRQAYTSEVIHRLAATIKDGEFASEPEPMPDCIISDAPDALERALQSFRPATYPERTTTYTVKIGDCYTRFQDRNAAIAFYRDVVEGQAA